MYSRTGNSQKWMISFLFGLFVILSANVSADAAQVAAPTFSAGSGTYVSSLSVSISCATSGATIRYTTNGSTPTSTSAIYRGSLTLATSSTLKAMAFKSGLTNSAVTTATYTLVVATPSLSRASGTYTGVVSVTIACATSGATIRYTTNGTNPTSSSLIYSGITSLAFPSTTILKAKAFKVGLMDS